MKTSTGIVLAVIALFASAFGGYTLCHQRAVIAFQQEQDSVVVAQHRTDSVTHALNDTILRSHSLAQSDSLLHIALALREVQLKHRGDSASVVATIATAHLDSARSELDSLRVYRSELVPSLRDEIAGLHDLLTTADSSKAVALDWGQQQAKQVAAFRVLHGVDSTQIVRDSVALATAAKAITVQSRAWWKPHACLFGGVNLAGHPQLGIGGCYVL